MPYTQGHAKGRCTYGMSCFADIPCSEMRQEQNMTQQEQQKQLPQDDDMMTSVSSRLSLSFMTATTTRTLPFHHAPLVVTATINSATILVLRDALVSTTVSEK